MSKKEKLLEKFLEGQADESFSFQDFAIVIQRLGYKFAGKNGSHRIFRKKGFPTISFQPREDGKAKAYQIKQLRDTLKRQ